MYNILRVKKLQIDYLVICSAFNNEVYDATNTGDSIGSASGFGVRSHAFPSINLLLQAA
jgi:hypothetical protein